MWKEKRRPLSRSPFANCFQCGLKPFADHEFQQVADAVAVAPLVVVPAHKFEEAAVQLEAGASIVNGGGLGVDEIGGDNLVGRPFENAFEIGLAGIFHGGRNLGVAGRLHGFHREIHARDGRRRHAERHTRELALHFGADEADGARGSGGGGDDVDGCAAAAFPILLARAVHGLLRGGVSVDGGHQTFLDAETFLEENVHERREAVRGAARVGDDVVIGRIVLLVVHAHDDRDVLALCRSRNNNLLRASHEMTFGLVGFGEEAGGFDDDVHAQRLPRQLGGRFGGDHFDLGTVDDEHIVLGFVRRRFLGADGSGEAALRGIVLEQIREIVGWDNVTDGDDFHFLADETLLDHRAEDQTADAAEPVDCNFDRHIFSVHYRQTLQEVAHIIHGIVCVNAEF